MNARANRRRLFNNSTSWLILAALLCLPFANLQVTTGSPWLELGRMLQGLLQPSLGGEAGLITALFNTLAFALEGVALGVVAGFLLSLRYRSRWVRALAAFVRAIHELFWALIFIQLFGLSPLTGVLAIAIPYAGIFAKVFGEQYEETSPAPRDSLPASHSLAAFLYTTLPQAWPNMVSYTLYRMECGIRSSAILGFIGLPTLGFHLETAFSEGLYDQGAALLYILILLVLSLRLWLRRALIPALLALAFWYLPPVADIKPQLLLRFFSEDIIPTPLRHGGSLNEVWPWLTNLWHQQIQPGLFNTLILSQLALILTGAISLLLFPLISTHFAGRIRRGLGHGLLASLRSTPEYILAFVFLLLLGPSMLPAILALGLHTGAIIAHLIGTASNQLVLRADAPRGINLYFYEVLPRLYRHLLAFLLYRWEVIMRESAILGMLGIATLGFYIDSAFEEFRLDRAMLLILVSALLNIAVDQIARRLRRNL